MLPGHPGQCLCRFPPSPDAGAVLPSSRASMGPLVFTPQQAERIRAELIGPAKRAGFSGVECLASRCRLASPSGPGLPPNNDTVETTENPENAEPKVSPLWQLHEPRPYALRRECPFLGLGASPRRQRRDAAKRSLSGGGV